MAVLQLLQRMKMRQFYPIVLLVVSNIFMTFAWYGHLKYKSAALWTVILASWGIAFFEYCFQVPANRIGHDYFTAPQLKIMQEIIFLFSSSKDGTKPRYLRPNVFSENG